MRATQDTAALAAAAVVGSLPLNLCNASIAHERPRTVSSGAGMAFSACCLASTAACSSSQEGALSANWMACCGAAVVAAPPCGSKARQRARVGGT